MLLKIGLFYGMGHYKSATPNVRFRSHLIPWLIFILHFTIPIYEFPLPKSQVVTLVSPHCAAGVRVLRVEQVFGLRSAHPTPRGPVNTCEVL